MTEISDIYIYTSTIAGVRFGCTSLLRVVVVTRKTVAPLTSSPLSPSPRTNLPGTHASPPEAEAVLCKAIGSLVKHRYGKANPTLRDEDPAWRRDLDTLRHAELSHVSALTRGPQRPGRG